PLVNDEMSRLVERPVASVLITDKGSFPCMGALVSCKVTGIVERPIAPVMITDKESACCVGSWHVPP
ncbi:hypothetical protein, partial [Sansalvadorimonas verongulae]|uniref:hypothetical protein n=1 Tax=Sansalvadorimonas verongulae TaxID=2172824 RepID=UPI001E55E778